MKTRQNSSWRRNSRCSGNCSRSTASPAVVCDPDELSFDGEALRHAGQPVDLVYKRLTDFALDTTASAANRTPSSRQSGAHPQPAGPCAVCRQAQPDAVVRPGCAERLGVDAANPRQTLLAGIPKPCRHPEQAETFWAERKRWFFKPPAGFGSRAAYRGDKLTKRVFEEILHGGYIAQGNRAAVGTRAVGEQTMKADIRCCSNGHIQLVAARLYQGQTTNFRTPGGGLPRCSLPSKTRHESFWHRRLFRLRQDHLAGKLLPRSLPAALKVSVIKHAHHGFDIDRPGKDSYRHREAGATEVLLSCSDRWALMHERREEPSRR